MEKEHAYRNIKLCTKDCLCLFVCPTGASDTENGQIDFEKCIGCGACSRACPSHAITMVPNKMPAQQKKSKPVVDELFKITNSKIDQIKILNYQLENAKTEEEHYWEPYRPYQQPAEPSDAAAPNAISEESGDEQQETYSSQENKNEQQKTGAEAEFQNEN